MSKEEKINTITEDINDIYIHLTKEEPTPDEEIKARDELITLFKDIKLLDAFSEYNQLINTVIDQLKDWDTLELWFKELKEVPNNIEKFLQIVGLIESLEIEKPREEVPDEKEELPKEVLEKAEEKKVSGLDINQIVNQVSEQFKGEINTLRERIEVLREELKEKGTSLDDVNSEKLIRKIKPKKGSKLPPPTIKIPSVKKSKEPPKVKVSSSHKAKEKEKEQTKEKAETIEQQLKEGIDEQSEQVETIEKEVLEEKEEKIPQIDEIDEEPNIPPTPTPEVGEKKPKKAEEISSPPKKPDKSLDRPKVPSLPSSKKKEKEISKPPTPPESQVKKNGPPEKPTQKKISPKHDEKRRTPRITPVAIEEPTNEEKAKQEKNPFVSEIPKIAQVKIEEKEQEENVENELLSVFSPFGNDKQAKEKVKKKEKQKAHEISIQPERTQQKKGGNQRTEKKDSSGKEEELPKDKDSLYQELIALEGKRYSLEKNFKGLEERYRNGNLSDEEYKQENEELKERLDSITSRITKIRRIVSSL